MKKCPFCAEEIQNEAIKCRYCGEMLTGTPPPIPSGKPDVTEPQPSLPQSKKPGEISTAAGCVLIAIMTVVICFVGYQVATYHPVPTTSSSLITKAQWREKVRPYWNPGGGIRSVSAAEFKRFMGEPTRTQLIDLTAYWYYECSDGMVQIELIDPDANGGLLMIQGINYY